MKNFRNSNVDYVPLHSGLSRFQIRVHTAGRRFKLQAGSGSDGCGSDLNPEQTPDT